MKISKVKLDSISQDPNNARKHSVKNIDSIKGSLRKFAQQKPIVVDESGVILAGNGTYQAAQALGWTHIEVVKTTLKGWQASAFALADNRTAELGEWDMDQLEAQLGGLEDIEEIDLKDIGFDDDDLNEFLGERELTDEEKAEQAKKDDAVPDVAQNEYGVKLGDIWLLGDHRLMCGDSTDKDQVGLLMDGAKADMVFTDPPYGIRESSKDHSSRGKLAKPTIYKRSNWDDSIPDKAGFDLMVANSKHQVIFGGNYFTQYLNATPSWIVWNKKNGANDFADCELAWTSHKKACRLYEQTWNGMIREGETGKRVHPTQKPIALAEWCFEKYGDPKSVLDLFLGSGSTLIACEKTDRRCYGMEIDPHYISVIIKRWEEYTGEKALKK